MKLLLAVICLLSCGTFMQCQDMTNFWYQMRLIENVVPPFRNGYIKLQRDVVGLIMSNMFTEDSEGLTEFGAKLTCGVASVRHNLYLATNGSQKIQAEVNRKLLETVAAMSAKESEMSAKQTEIHRKSAEVDNLRKEVAIAEQGVRDREAGLSNAENDLRIAQEKVDSARRCLSGRRRRKRFFRRLVRGIGRGVRGVLGFIERGICSVVNYGGIDSAKGARGNAENNLREARNRLDSYRNQLETTIGQRNNVERELEQLRSQLSVLSSTVTTLRAIFQSVSGMDKELKLVMTSINSVWDASNVLYTALMGIVDFNLVIGPLNDIFIQLTKNSLLSRIPIKLMTDEEILQGKEILMKVSDVLSKMPLNTDSIDAKCSK